MQHQLLPLFPDGNDLQGKWYSPGDDLSAFQGKDSLFVTKIMDWYIYELGNGVRSNNWKEADKIGFSSYFTIYDQAASRNLIKTVIREMGLDDKTYKPASIAAHISNAKNRLILPEAYLSDNAVRMADQAAKIPMTGEIYLRYMSRLRHAEVKAFDDIMLLTNK